MALWRVAHNGGARWALGAPDIGPTKLLPAGLSLDMLLDGKFWMSQNTEEITTLSSDSVQLAPVEEQEVWGAGVTYLESRYAREEESTRPDVYKAVYHSNRPELFLKAVPGTVVGPGETVGIRADSTWNVPEPELGLVVDAEGVIVAYTIGNDVSSRAIEGENPLFLPQAKIYDLSCAVGPCLVPVEEAPAIQDLEIELTITSVDGSSWYGSTTGRDLRRKPEELVDYLFMARTFVRGVFLLTGTGIVPPGSVTLEEGDTVEIGISGLGTLRNKVKFVGRDKPNDQSIENAPSQLQS